MATIPKIMAPITAITTRLTQPGISPAAFCIVESAAVEFGSAATVVFAFALLRIRNTTTRVIAKPAMPTFLNNNL